MPMANYRAELAAQWIKGADQVKKKGKVTWRRLVEALRSKRLGQNGLADRIENDKCSQINFFDTVDTYTISVVCSLLHNSISVLYCTFICLVRSSNEIAKISCYLLPKSGMVHFQDSLSYSNVTVQYALYPHFVIGQFYPALMCFHGVATWPHSFQKTVFSLHE